MSQFLRVTTAARLFISLIFECCCLPFQSSIQCSPSPLPPVSLERQDTEARWSSSNRSTLPTIVCRDTDSVTTLGLGTNLTIGK